MTELIMDIPKTMKQVMVRELDTDFRKATEVVEVKVPSPDLNEVLIKVRYFGINASDILFSSGTYKPGVPPPYPAGLEVLGEVVATGAKSKLKVGQYVVIFDFGCFSEYLVVAEDVCVPVPSDDPAYLSLIISATTASLAFETKAELKTGETVLVTGAAGGTGQFAVQLAKLAGCHVIGTCSTEEKAEFLKELGCDRTINYNRESLDKVLQMEYPKGIDVVYETIGNHVFDTALTHLADFGRLIVIGAISSYEKPGSLFQKTTNSTPIPITVLWKNADIRGFYLPYYVGDPMKKEMERLVDMYRSGQFKVLVDIGQATAKGPFVGIHKVYDAVEHMFSRSNTGKIVVAM